MASPFSPQVATRLIRENPGRSAGEIVGDALDCGIISSKASNPIMSQRGALVKMYLGRRLPEVQRDEQKIPFKYHLKGETSVK